MTDPRARFGWRTLLCTLLCLVVALPPAGFGFVSGAEFLVIPGLAGFYALGTSSSKPLRAVYLLGVLHMLGVSWSLVHLHWSAVLAISLVGGFYYSLAILWMRGWPNWRPGSIVFAFGVAATQWLRAEMPEIGYPHGQFCHSLYEWPRLLAAVSWGGEPLANLLFAWLGAAGVDLYRAWRTEESGFRAARSAFFVAALVNLLSVLVPAPAAHNDMEGQTVSVAALQVGGGTGFYMNAALRLELIRKSVAVTEAVLQADVVPEVVIWPESSSPFLLRDEGQGIRLLRFQRLDLPRLPPQILFVSGTELHEGIDAENADRYVVAAALRGGQLDGRFEKQRLVPAGEVPPFARWLPPSWAEGFVAWCSSLVGQSIPNIRLGREQPLLVTPSGIPFGALVCYDNAYPDVSRSHVARGARFLAVLSNETWYGRGSELDQFIALTVCRALETGTPLIRSTVDGASVYVDAKGRVVSGLSYGVGPELLQVEIELGPGELPPFAWLHAMLRWLLALTLMPFLADVACSAMRKWRARRGQNLASDTK